MAVNKNKKYVCLALNLNKDLGREIHSILENLKNESKQHYIMRAIKYFHDHEKQIKQMEALEAFNIDPETFTKVFLSVVSGGEVNLPKNIQSKKNPDEKKDSAPDKKKRPYKTSGVKIVEKKESKPVVEQKPKEDSRIIYGDDLEVDPAKLDQMMKSFDDMFK